MSQTAKSAEPAPKYDAWLVDLDGTLYWNTGVRLAMAVELAVGGWRVAGRLKRFRHEQEALRAEKDVIPGDPFVQQLERTAAALGLPREELERDVRHWMIQKPSRYLSWFRRKELIDEIRKFRANGGRTALVSDYPATEKLAALAVSELFDIVVASGETDGPRRLKPDPDGYLRASQALGVAPAQCLVVGDREDADGAAARAAGMGFRLVS